MDGVPAAVTIDGSLGEGGGQIVRTSLALSVLLGSELTLFNIRAGRTKPGLQAQHLTAVRAAASVSHAQARGGELGPPGPRRRARLADDPVQPARGPPRPLSVRRRRDPGLRRQRLARLPDRSP